MLNLQWLCATLANATAARPREAETFILSWIVYVLIQLRCKEEDKAQDDEEEMLGQAYILVQFNIAVNNLPVGLNSLHSTLGIDPGKIARKPSSSALEYPVTTMPTRGHME